MGPELRCAVTVVAVIGVVHRLLTVNDGIKSELDFVEPWKRRCVTFVNIL